MDQYDLLMYSISTVVILVSIVVIYKFVRFVSLRKEKAAKGKRRKRPKPIDPEVGQRLRSKTTTFDTTSIVAHQDTGTQTPFSKTQWIVNTETDKSKDVITEDRHLPLNGGDQKDGSEEVQNEAGAFNPFDEEGDNRPKNYTRPRELSVPAKFTNPKGGEKET